jgi:hypothetical protein
MSNTAETKFTIRAVNKTQVAFSQIKRSVDSLDRKFGRLGSMLTSKIAPAFAAVFAGREIVDTITKFERLEASLKTVTGSAEKAASAFKAIDEFAAKTPFQLEEVTKSFIKLKALGLTPSERALESYGNTAIAMGKSLDQMIEAVADATTGEFERLKEFGIKSKTQGDQVIFTFQGVSTSVGKNAAEIEAYLLSLGEVQFAGAIEAKADTLVNAIAKMKDAFSKLVKSIGDAGLTECFIKIANGIRWLVEQITASIDPIVYWTTFLNNEFTKFGNLFVAILKGVGNSFIAFAETIATRFEALGKDLAAFVENPLAGVSFENTNRVLETGLVESMSNAFDKALAEAREFNQKLDEELALSRNKINKSDSQNTSLEKMFAGQNSKGVGNVAKSSSRNYGNITSDSEFDKLKAKSFDTSKEIDDNFDSLGSRIEDSIANSLKRTGGKFESFSDMAKTILGDISQTLLSSFFSGSGGFGGLGSSGGGGLGGLFDGIGGMFSGFFADGGKISPGKFGVVGENGPELAFAGNSPLNIMSDLPNGGNVTINMNVQTPDVASFRQSGSQIAADIARQIERARRNL